MVAAGGAGWKLQSECQPAPKFTAFSSGSRRSSSTLGWPAIGLTYGSSPYGPICRVKASSWSRVSGWFGKQATPCSAQAAFTAAKVSPSRGRERSTPSMRAPKPDGSACTAIVWSGRSASFTMGVSRRVLPKAPSPSKHPFASARASL